MKTLVLVNPGSGGGRGRRTWEALRRAVPEVEGCAPIVEASATAARDALRAALDDGAAGRLLVLGGDGSAQLAVETLLAAERGDLPFTLVPAGTGSDFARHLGLPRDPEQALRRALAATGDRPIDALAIDLEGGETEDQPRRRVCLNILSAGVSGAVDQEVERARQASGRASYLLTTLRVLATYGAEPFRVVADGETVHDGPLWLAAAANGSSFGQGMRVAPDAREDDGWIDLVVVPPVARWRLPWLLPKFLRGAHVGLPEVVVRRARTVRFEPRAGASRTVYDLDGEVLRAGALTVRVLPGALRLLVQE